MNRLFYMEECSKNTHQKLLEVAGEVFAAEGFKQATVREICKRANTNIAAINYHFGDKEKLYEAVFRYIHSLEADKQPDPSCFISKSPEKDLEFFIQEMLSRMLISGCFSWKGTLMAREMVEPSPALDLIIELWISPCWERLKEITAAIIEKPAASEENHIAASAVMAQCFFHKHAKEVLFRLNPNFQYTEAQVTLLSKHLIAFTYGGLLALKNL